MKKFIIVTTEKVGFHKYNDAPDNVAFLRDIHRHKFYIKMGLEVRHTNRELEFFTVLNELNYFLNQGEDKPMMINSCEMLATQIKEWADKEYQRNCWVEVWEDNENGARVE